MKRLIYALALMGLAALCTMPLDVFAAPDTLDVAALPAGNVNTVINSDTLSGGVRTHPDRVYRLTRGSVYQVTEAIKINGSVNIMAPAGTTRPPVLAPAILSDNSSIDHFFDFLGKGGKVTMSSVYLLSQRADNNWLGWSDGMRVDADSVSIKLRDVIFDGFSDSGIRVYSQWTKLDVQDCKFRNHQHSSSWFGGQPFMTDAPNHLDTVKFINNTFIANNSYSWSIRGYDRWSTFDHNTMVFGTVNPFLMRQGSHMRIRNNIFYAMHAMGGNPDHVINGWFLNYPDTASSSIVRLRGYDTVSAWYHLWGNSAINGPNSYVDSAHGVTVPMLAPALRVVDVRNNDCYWPTKYTNFVQAYNDTVKMTDTVDVPNGTATEVKMVLKRKLYMPTWVSAYTRWTVDSLAGKLSSNVRVDPALTADPGFGSGLTNHIDSLTAYVWKIVEGKLDNRWAYPNNTLYPPTWPLPEVASLAYSNTALQSAGTDGFALGDLNYFPTQKAAWLLTDVQQEEPIPQEYTLSQNYPNPFNPTTKIDFSIPKQSNVVLKVFNILGQEVATLVAEVKAAGRYSVDFDASKLASGAYVYRLTAGNVVKVNKMMFVK